MNTASPYTQTKGKVSAMKKTYTVGQRVYMLFWEGRTIRRNGEIRAIERRFLTIKFDGIAFPTRVPRCGVHQMEVAP